MLDFIKGLATAILAAAIIRIGVEVLFEKAGLFI